VLEIRGVRAGYGAINVLWDVELSFAEGKLTTIIGPNGAGKTTLLRAIMGQIPLGAGQIQLDGVRVDGTSTSRMAALGVGMIPEGRMVFRDMRVEDNLLLGAYSVRHRPGIAARLEDAYARFPRLRQRRAQLAGSLSGGEAQMLAMARGLMAEPRLLLIDEPSLGLAPVVVQEVFTQLAQLKEQGRTIVLVEQNTRRAIDIADHVYVMQAGKVLMSRPAREVQLDEVHRLYFGR
jgi:branched-chain amino acid transport system ATP-binding protein